VTDFCLSVGASSKIKTHTLFLLWVCVTSSNRPSTTAVRIVSVISQDIHFDI
jgi:hypothetical protein